MKTKLLSATCTELVSVFILIITCQLLIAPPSKAQNSITWNSGVNIASSASGNDHPRIAVNGSGNPLVIWHNAGNCMFARWNGTAFTSPVILNPMSMTIAGAGWMGPDIAAHGDTVYVVFKQTPEASDTCHVFCVRSFNGGITFSAPVQVDNINDSISRFPTVTTDDIGNPIVGFMKFNPSFGNARWVVTKSTDFGNTFSVDVKASGWSSMTSTVCDCCPGAITCSGNSVALLYRDNNSNIRDSWAGISTNTANSFSGGMGIDQQNWFISACPSTGPDGVIIGDTLYSTYMSGASGMGLVYGNKSSISAMNGSAGVALTGAIAGLTQQNYPRIATDGTAMSVVWKQTVSGNTQLPILFTNNIANGFSAAYDTVDLNDITNADVAISNGNVFVVWQDDNSGTVKYRSGSFTSVSVIQENDLHNSISVFPNPTRGKFNLKMNQFEDLKMKDIEIYNVMGEKIYPAVNFQINSFSNFQIDLSQANNGVYFVKVKTDEGITVRKIVVSK